MCLIGRRDGDDMVVWKLEIAGHVARELARYPIDSLNEFSPSFGIAPNERMVVTLAGRRGVPHLIAMDGTIRTLPAGMTLPQSVGWTRDPEAIVVAGMDVEGGSLNVVAVRLDGTTEVLWSSATTWFGRIVTHAETDLIGGNARTFRTELMQLDHVDTR